MDPGGRSARANTTADGTPAAGAGGDERDRTAVRFTVDVERDWAGNDRRGVREALPRLVERLDRAGANATFFVVADLLDDVAAAVPTDGPHEVGSHGLTHATLTDLWVEDVRHEVAESRRVIEAAGYRVDGFRAPFYARPPGLGAVLADAGYRYDASVGTVHPLRRPTPEASEPLPVLPSGSLRGGRVPCSLTNLRLLHPVGTRLVGPDPQTFSCHLHEFLDHTSGWSALPPGLRHLHKRGAGPTAWAVLDRLLARPDLRFTSCRDHPDAPWADVDGER